jgi:hypothetical protein
MYTMAAWSNKCDKLSAPIWSRWAAKTFPARMSSHQLRGWHEAALDFTYVQRMSYYEQYKKLTITVVANKLSSWRSKS